MNALRNHQEQGFTLLELMIVVTIVGILGAIATPSFLAMNNTAKVNDALNTVQGALQEAQRQAMRNGKQCQLTINTTTNKITGTNGCLLTGDRTLPTGVTMYSSGGNTINYGFRGNTDTTTTIKIYLADNSGKQKCLVLSSPLGVIRTGKYNASATDSCEPE